MAFIKRNSAMSERRSTPFEIVRRNFVSKVADNFRFEGLVCNRFTKVRGRNSSLVVFGLAVHSIAGSILLWGNFPVEGIFPLELTWVQTPFPPKLFRMRV